MDLRKAFGLMAVWSSRLPPELDEKYQCLLRAESSAQFPKNMTVEDAQLVAKCLRKQDAGRAKLDEIKNIIGRVVGPVAGDSPTFI